VPYLYREDRRRPYHIALLLSLLGLSLFVVSEYRFDWPMPLALATGMALGGVVGVSIQRHFGLRVRKCAIQSGRLEWSSRRILGPSYRRDVDLKEVDSMTLTELEYNEPPWRIFFGSPAGPLEMDRECIGDWKAFLRAVVEETSKLKIQVLTRGEEAKSPVHEVFVRSLGPPVEYVRNARLPSYGAGAPTS